jgi:hypothetical protein
MCNGLTKEALVHLGNQAVLASGLTTVIPPFEPPGNYYVRPTPGGELGAVLAARPPIHWHLSSLESFAEAVKYHDILLGGHRETYEDSPINIFVGDSMVVAKWDCPQSTVPHLLSVRLVHTLPYRWLMRMWLAPTAVWMTQRGLVDILEIDLVGSLEENEDGDLAAMFRSIKFSSADTGERDIQHDRSSLGNAMQEELMQGNKKPLPRYIEVDAKVFNVLDDAQDSPGVICHLRIRPRDRQFAIHPEDAGMINLAKWAANHIEATLYDLIDIGKRTSVQVFQGEPDLPSTAFTNINEKPLRRDDDDA